MACLTALVVVGATHGLAFSQGPDLPQVPRLQGICRLEDGPGPGWSTFRVPSLGLQMAHPFGWTPWQEPGRVTFLAAGRIVIRISRIDTAGLDPMAWLRARLHVESAQQCRVVAIGPFVGHQCFNHAADVWTTYLLASNRVLAVEAPATLSREVHCGVLAGLVDLEEAKP